MPRELWTVSILALVCIIGGVWWFVAERPRQISPAKITPNIPSDVELRLSKPRFHGIDGGKIVWEMEADGLDLTKNVPVLRIDNLKKAVLLNESTPELTLTASSLERNTSTGNMVIDGNVLITGKNLLLRTPSIKWDARKEILTAPEKLGVQAGDITVSTLKSATYDVKSGILRCDGSVMLTVQGNTIRAGSATVNVRTQAFTLANQGMAEFNVADLASWAAGRNLPAVPAIPESVKQRYRDYLKTMESSPGKRPSSSRLSPRTKGRP
ncbi:MAG: hypothetical protein ACYC7E_13405 [Armatimonadota bacterium]